LRPIAVLSTTFLGHQGWMFQSKTSCILVDPLLCEDFGHAHGLGYRVYPPRVWRRMDAGAFPSIDAVVLTHEHDDHFDIPSLARLERSIPIFLSSRSSSAGRAILGEMGFQVHPLLPGRTTKLGDLELTPFPGDHVTVDCGDEWDTLPFFVRDSGGSGNFFSMVDITLTEQHVAWAHTRAPRPVLLGWTNNALDWSHMADFLRARGDATQECFTKMGVGHKLVSVKWGAPDATLMCAGGFAFEGDRAWLNQRVFCVDNEAVCQQLGKIYPAEQFHATRPGQTFVMEGGKLRKTLPEAPFLTVAPRESWPSRARSDVDEVPDYGPATGRCDLEGDEPDQLRRGLDELAASFVGGTLFRGLHSLLEDTVEDRLPTFAFVLRHGAGDERLVRAYVPSGCTFALGADDAREAYLAGMECWATDLLAVLRGEMSPIALTYGRARLWNALPERLRFDIFPELYRVSHPLRRPVATLEMYRRQWRASVDVAPTLQGRR
jgi:glyoxylase-like metal-dependent hydrolase (beta-lactamase superfamily II)